MSHVGVDMLIGRAAEPVILICVPLRVEGKMLFISTETKPD